MAGLGVARGADGVRRRRLVALRLAGGGIDDRCAVERGKLDAVALLLDLTRKLETLLRRVTRRDRALFGLLRPAPRHQDTSPTVAGSPAPNSTAPSADTQPPPPPRALPSLAT